jgi:hypothetical protein
MKQQCLLFAILLALFLYLQSTQQQQGAVQQSIIPVQSIISGGGGAGGASNTCPEFPIFNNFDLDSAIEAIMNLVTPLID